jgi:hypothetical protein
MRLLTRQGVLVEEQGVPYLAGIEADQALMPLQAGSCTYRIALGPRARREGVEPASGLGTWRIRLASLVRQCARLQPACGGAARDAHERNELERLCRYITRPAIANERLKGNRTGDVVLRLKSAYRDGTTGDVAAGIHASRLAALVPRPR